MPKAIKKKTGKKTAETGLEMQDKLSEIKSGLKKRQKTVVTYTLIAVALILAVAGGFLYKNSQDAKARQLEYEAYKIYHNEFQKRPLSDQERFQKSIDLFRQSYSIRKSPRVLLYIADAYFGLGKYDDSLNALNDFVKNHVSERDLIPVAYKKIADIQIKKGNRDEALKTLDTLYKSPGSIFKDYALIESARILENAGKKEEAAAKYRELAEKFKDSPFVEEAKAKLGEKKEG
jgi:predicted negative regulator of RcsB-dependent stress response